MGRGEAQVLRVLARGAAGGFMTDVAGMGLLLMMHVLLARALGEDAYGALSLATSWIAILVLPATVGLDTAMVRYVSQYRAGEQWELLAGFVRAALVIVLATSLLVGAGLAITGLLGFSGDLQGVLALAGLVLPLQALGSLLQAGMRGLKRVVAGLAPLAIVRPLVVIAVVAAFQPLSGRTLSAAGGMGVIALAFLVVALVLAWLLRGALPAEIRTVEPRFEVRRWLRTSAPLLLVSGMRVLLNQVDIVLVGALVGAREAGIYGVASRLARLMTFGLTASNRIAAPLIAELFARGERAQLQRVTGRASWMAAAGALVVGLALVLFRERFLALFGNGFVSGGTVLVLLAGGHLINALTGPVGLLLNMTGHEGANAKIYAVVTLMNALLNVPAIRWFGMEGAAAVTGGLVAFQNLWCWFVVRRVVGVNSSVFHAHASTAPPS